jgi:eukaryotic-like serine/threonine-protein kinase
VTAGPLADATPAGSPADATTAPVDDAGWTVILTELYARRARAFAAGDSAALAGVHLAGSALLDRDVTALRALTGSGQTLTGFAPQVRRLESVTAEGSGRVVVRLVDELPRYRVESADGGGQDVAGRGAARVRLVLQQTAAGWRISDARVEP